MAERTGGGTVFGPEPVGGTDAWLEDELRTVLREETAGLRLDVTAPEVRRLIAVEDRSRRRSMVLLVGLAAVLVAALAIPFLGPLLAPAIGPAAPSATPLATPSGGHEPGWMGGERTAIVIRWDGPDLATVLACDPDGTVREIAPVRRAIARAAPAYLRQIEAPGTFPVVHLPTRVSDRGFLAIPVVAAEPADGSGRNGVVVVDLRTPDALPILVAGPGGGLLDFGWGPTGLLAIAIPDGVVVYDPVARSVRTVRGDSVVTSGTWAFDGSGLWAQRLLPGGPSPFGVLRLDGDFAPGVVRLYGQMRKRVELDGRLVSWSGHGDGTARTKTLLVTDPTFKEELRWYEATERGGTTEPMPLDASWDASGTGIWVLLRDATIFSVAHLDGPGRQPDVAARFPRRPDDAAVDFTSGPRPADPAFVGMSPDDSLVVVRRPVQSAGRETLQTIWIVDTVTGLVTETPGQEFAGWANASGATYPLITRGGARPAASPTP